MQQEKYTFISKNDGLEIEVLEVYPFIQPKGIVQIAHGMAEHKERYIEFMEFLSRHGYITIINDHRGHGNSIKSKSDRGYFYDENGEFIVNDVHDITLMMKEKYPNLPVYLFGHSMGSLVVRKYLKLYDKDIDKLIVCGSPSNNPLGGLALGLVKFLEKIQGSHHRSNLINKLAFGSFDNKFSESEKNRWLSANPENVKYYNNCDSCGFTFTLNGFKNLFILMKDVYNENGWIKENLDIPILFLAGDQDPVIISIEAWQNAQIFLHKIGYTKIRSKLYKNMRHEILNEIGKDEVMNDVLHFIES